MIHFVVLSFQQLIQSDLIELAQHDQVFEVGLALIIFPIGNGLSTDKYFF